MTTIPTHNIPRTRYIQRITPFLGKSIVKVLTGQRRVGKSYILYQLMDVVKKNDPDAPIIYINMEDLSFDSIRSAADLNAEVRKRMIPGRLNYIFIDEIQEIEQFEKAVRSLMLDSDADLTITGSNARLLSGELATLLGGRTVEFQIHSLDYTEFLLFHGLPDNDRTLELYLRFGGLPYLIHLKLEEDVVNGYLQSIWQSIIYRDVVARHHLRSMHFLEQLVHFLADSVGSPFSAKRISDYLKSQKIKMAPNQVQSFIGHLEDAFIIQRASRFDLRGKRILESGVKYYFENLGIRHILTGYRPDDKAKIIENAVYNHLVSSGYRVYTGWHDGREIDFVAVRNNETLYVQVTLELRLAGTVEREFGNLLRLKDNYRKILVTADTSFPNTYEGIPVVSLREMLRRET